MNNNPQKSSTAKKVLHEIKNDQVKMRPRIYFILKSVLIIFSVFLVAFFALYLTSLILFALRASGAWYLSGFRILRTQSFLHIIAMAIDLNRHNFTHNFRTPC